MERVERGRGGRGGEGGEGFLGQVHAHITKLFVQYDAKFGDIARSKVFMQQKHDKTNT